MFPVMISPPTKVFEKIDGYKPVTTEIMHSAQSVQGQRLLDQLLADLSPESPWGARKVAARRLGDIGNPAALSELLTALPADPFWMVRCSMIQALEKIADPRAIPTLQRIEKEDSFLTVRCHATKAINTLADLE